MRVVYQPVDAGEVMVQATESFPGGVRHLVRDEWKCDACGSTFFPCSALIAAEARGFQRGAQAQREADMETVALVMQRPKSIGKRAPQPVSIETVLEALRTAPLVTELRP